MATLFFLLVILNETTFIDSFLILCYVVYWLFRKNMNYCKQRSDFSRNRFQKLKTINLIRNPICLTKLLPYNYKFSPKRSLSSTLNSLFSVEHRYPVSSAAPHELNSLGTTWHFEELLHLRDRINARCHLCHGAAQSQSALALWYIVVVAFSNLVFVGV